MLILRGEGVKVLQMKHAKVKVSRINCQNTLKDFSKNTFLYIHTADDS